MCCVRFRFPVTSSSSSPSSDYPHTTASAIRGIICKIVIIQPSVCSQISHVRIRNTHTHTRRARFSPGCGQSRSVRTSRTELCFRVRRLCVHTYNIVYIMHTIEMQNLSAIHPKITSVRTSALTRRTRSPSVHARTKSPIICSKQQQ